MSRTTHQRAGHGIRIAPTMPVAHQRTIDWRIGFLEKSLATLLLREVSAMAQQVRQAATCRLPAKTTPQTTSALTQSVLTLMAMDHRKMINRTTLQAPVQSLRNHRKTAPTPKDRILLAPTPSEMGPLQTSCRTAPRKRCANLEVNTGRPRGASMDITVLG